MMFDLELDHEVNVSLRREGSPVILEHLVTGILCISCTQSMSGCVPLHLIASHECWEVHDSYNQVAANAHAADFVMTW